MVSWIHHHGRSAALARHLGLIPVWTPGWARERPAPLRYLTAAVRTCVALLPSRGPVIVMLPPLPALLVVLVARPGRRTRLVADLHGGVFLGKWSRVLGLTLRLLRGRAAIVTNEAQASTCRQAGVTTFVLDDPLELPETPAEEDPSGEYVLAALSYDPDEPVAEILQAAAASPDTAFVLSGSPPPAVRRSAPGNVVFSGFVSRTRFVELLRGSAVVLALTTEENTMQRAAYEALEHVVPVVTSDTRVLRKYFGDAAVYARPTAGSIGPAVAEALRRRHDLRHRLSDLRERRLLDQGRALEEISRYLDGR